VRRADVDPGIGGPLANRLYETGDPERPRNTASPVFTVAWRLSTVSASDDSGTTCALAAFMRSAGTVHSPLSRSISLHSAHRASEGRVAVAIMNTMAER
jgi:hypothetical protein